MAAKVFILSLTKFHKCTMARQLTDTQLRAAIMDFLMKKGRWGAHYYPLDTLVNFLGRKVKHDGKRVSKAVKELVREGYLFLHKKGNTVSLNPARSREIAGYVEAVAP